MKKLIFILSSLMVATIVPAQELTIAGQSVDYILGSLGIYSIEDVSNNKKIIQIDQLHIDSKFEKLIGKQYKKEVKHNDMGFFRDEEHITIPGLVLQLPEDKKDRDVEFTLTTPQFHIVMENGKELYVGMTAEQFSAIFPLSWANRHTLTYDNGKFLLGVIFAYKQNGEIIGTDEALTFIVDKKTLKVEHISYHVRP